MGPCGRQPAARRAPQRRSELRGMQEARECGAWGGCMPRLVVLSLLWLQLMCVAGWKLGVGLCFAGCCVPQCALAALATLCVSWASPLLTVPALQGH